MTLTIPLPPLDGGRSRTATSPPLIATGLRGARIGLVTALLGTEAIHEEVNVVVHNAAQLMEQLGATVLSIAMPRLTTLTADAAIPAIQLAAPLSASIKLFYGS